MAMTMLQMAGAQPTPATMADGILLIIDAQREYTDGLLPLTGVQPVCRLGPAFGAASVQVLLGLGVSLAVQNFGQWVEMLASGTVVSLTGVRIITPEATDLAATDPEAFVAAHAGATGS